MSDHHSARMMECYPPPIPCQPLPMPTPINPVRIPKVNNSFSHFTSDLFPVVLLLVVSQWLRNPVCNLCATCVTLFVTVYVVRTLENPNFSLTILHLTGIYLEKFNSNHRVMGRVSVGVGSQADVKSVVRWTVVRENVMWILVRTINQNVQLTLRTVQYTPWCWGWVIVSIFSNS